MRALSPLLLYALLGATTLSAQEPVPAPVPQPAEQQPPTEPEQPVEQDPVQLSNELRKQAFAAEQRGDSQLAAETFLQLQELEPNNPDWVLRAADNLAKLARFNDAMDLLEASSRAMPDVLTIRARLARIFHMKADAMRQEGVFDSNVAFYYQDTIRTAEQVLELDADHLDARLLLASASYHLGQLDQALAAAEAAAERHPDSAGAYTMIGRVAYQRFKDADPVEEGIERAQWLERARAAFEQAAKTDPSRSLPLVRLGDLRAWTKDIDGALALYEQALILDPMAQVDHAWLRQVLAADERSAFYTTVRDAYLARDDRDPRGLGTLEWYLAQARFDAKDWEAAALGFGKALEAMPDSVVTHWWLLQSQYWAGQIADATRTALAYARISPQQFADWMRNDDQMVSILVGMAQKSFKRGRVADSRDLNQVIAYARHTPDAWNNYAFLCRETGRFEESYRAYTQALDLEPNSPQLLNDAAVILQYHLRSEDNLALARDYYQRAIAEAERLLDAGELEGAALDRTRVALRDARANLRKMGD